MLHVVIMAGGVGVRLWPQSRKASPKQLLSLISERSLIQETVDRLKGKVAPENILIITNSSQVDMMLKQLPELPAENIIGEPIGRGSAAAVALGAAIVASKDSDATMVVLSADHVIKPADKFWATVEAAVEAVADGQCLATLGIVPEFPATGFGYIHRGEKVADHDGISTYQVQRFVEKPHIHTATEYFRSGEFYWNAGIFVWRVDTIRDAFKNSMPDLYAAGEAITKAFGKADQDEVIKREYGKIQSQTIDYGIMEKAENIKVIEAAFQWDDIGSWRGLDKHREKDDKGNILGAPHIGIDTHNCTIIGDGQLIATIGVDDLVIVRTDDAILICQKERAQEVRNLVDALKEKNLDKYL